MLKRKTKEFKEGMVAGAKPFEDKMEQLQNENIAAVQEMVAANSNVQSELISIVREHDNDSKFGLRAKATLEDLGDSEKKIFAGLLYSFVETFKEPNQAQKDFFNTFLAILENQKPQEIDLKGIGSIQETDKQELLFLLFCEYGYIGNENFEFMNEKADEFKYFAVSDDTKENIRNYIKEEVRLRGIRGICDGLALLETTAQEAGLQPVQEIEETVRIDSPKHIKTAEVWKNQEIYISQTISISSSLEISNCKLIFESTAVQKFFILQRGGSIKVSGTEITASADCSALLFFEEKHAGDVSVVFERSTFDTCSHVFESFKTNIQLNNCTIYKCAYFSQNCQKLILHDTSIVDMQFPFIQCNDLEIKGGSVSHIFDAAGSENEDAFIRCGNADWEKVAITGGEDSYEHTLLLASKLKADECKFLQYKRIFKSADVAQDTPDAQVVEEIIKFAESRDCLYFIEALDITLKSCTFSETTGLCNDSNPFCNHSNGRFVAETSLFKKGVGIIYRSHGGYFKFSDCQFIDWKLDFDYTQYNGAKSDIIDPQGLAPIGLIVCAQKARYFKIAKSMGEFIAATSRELLTPAYLALGTVKHVVNFVTEENIRAVLDDYKKYITDLGKFLQLQHAGISLKNNITVFSDAPVIENCSFKSCISKGSMIAFSCMQHKSKKKYKDCIIKDCKFIKCEVGDGGLLYCKILLSDGKEINEVSMGNVVLNN